MTRRFIFILFLSIWPLARVSAIAVSSDTLNFNSHIIASYESSESENANEQFELERFYVSSKYQARKNLVFFISALFNELGDPQKNLELAYAQFKSPWGEVQAGQFSMPLTQEITSLESELHFNNRSKSVSELFAHQPNGADIGLQWKLNHPRWNIAYALVNGQGANANNTDFRKTFVSRVGYHHRDFQIAGYAYDGRVQDSAGLIVQNRWGGEILLGRPGQSIKGEYHRGQDDSRQSRGWFIEADLILGIFSPEAYRKWSWLQKIRPMLRAESYDPDIHVLLNRETTTSLALHVWPHPRWQLTIQQDWTREEDPNQQLPNDLFSFQAQVRL